MKKQTLSETIKFNLKVNKAIIKVLEELKNQNVKMTKLLAEEREKPKATTTKKSSKPVQKNTTAKPVKSSSKTATKSGKQTATNKRK